MSADDEQRRGGGFRRAAGWAILVAAMVGLLMVACVSTGRLLSHSGGATTDGAPPYRAALTTATDGWASSGDCAFRDGAYHVATLQEQGGVICFAPAGAYADVDLSVAAHPVTLDRPEQSYGLAFRGVSNHDAFVFAVTADGQVAWAGFLQDGRITRLTDAWQLPPGVSRVAGAQHTLAVRVSGASIICLIDGAQVGAFSDARYTSGIVGVFAGPGLDVAFTDFAAIPAASATPS